MGQQSYVLLCTETIVSNPQIKLRRPLDDNTDLICMFMAIQPQMKPPAALILKTLKVILGLIMLIFI